jgi:uncharacterized protein (TIGR03437 family)
MADAWGFAACIGISAYQTYCTKPVPNAFHCFAHCFVWHIVFAVWRYDFIEMPPALRFACRAPSLLFLFAGLAAAQAPRIDSVQVPGSSNPTVLSPGAVVQITGAGFGSAASAVSVGAGGAGAYVLSANSSVIVAQLPVSLPAQGTAALTVSTPHGSASTTISLAYASPAFWGQTNAGNVPYLTDYKDRSANVVPFQVDAQHPAVPGDYLEVRATGLGLTTPPPGGPPAPTGITPAGPPLYSAQVQPIVYVGPVLIPSSATKATLVPGEAGVFAVDFQLPVNGVPAGPNAFSLNVSNAITLPASLPVDSGIAVVTGVVNGANFAVDTPVAPGSIASVFSSNLESVLYNGIFPTNLVHNTSVAINSLTAPMYDLVGPSNQVNIQVPVELPDSGSVTVIVSNSKGAGQAFTFPVAPAAPGIFRIHAPGSSAQNAAVLFSGKKWYAMPTAFASSLGILTNCAANKVNPQSYCGQPAKAGDDLEIYATGLGKVTPLGNPNGVPLGTGVVAPTNPLILYETPQKAVVTVGGVSATVIFSGVAPGFAGLNQINFILPQGVAAGDAVPVTVSMPGSPVTDTATIAVQ